MKNIVLYRCRNCGGSNKTVNLPWVREFVLACGGQLEVLHILRAIEDGEAGVCLVHCDPQACKTITGAETAIRRFDYARALLKEAGVDEQRTKKICCSDSINLNSELSLFMEEIKSEKS